MINITNLTGQSTAEIKNEIEFSEIILPYNVQILILTSASESFYILLPNV